MRAIMGSLFMLALSSGCGESKSSSSNVCVPGATQACTGPGSCKGGQQCDADGKVWGPCDCGTDTGGAGGDANGGNAGTTGGQTSSTSSFGTAGESSTGGSPFGGGGSPTGGITSGGGDNPTGGVASTGGTTGISHCSALTADYCSCLPAFTGSQVVDGAGNEFSEIAGMTFALSSAPYTHALQASAVDEVVTVRAGWSDQALLLHVHVEDPSVYPDPASTLWNGDNVQVFAAGTDGLTGTYTGTEDGGAIHVLVAAPDTAGTTRSVAIYQNGTASTVPFTNGTYAARRLTDGYEVELRLLWASNAKARVSGARFGFDLVVGSATLTSGGLVLEGGLANNPVPSSSPCSLGGRVQPGCDDRTWCTPVLE